MIKKITIITFLSLFILAIPTIYFLPKDYNVIKTYSKYASYEGKDFIVSIERLMIYDNTMVRYTPLVYSHNVSNELIVRVDCLNDVNVNSYVQNNFTFLGICYPKEPLIYKFENLKHATFYPKLVVDNEIVVDIHKELTYN